jgi:hypothetical protein
MRVLRTSRSWLIEVLRSVLFEGRVLEVVRRRDAGTRRNKRVDSRETEDLRVG